MKCPECGGDGLEVSLSGFWTCWDCSASGHLEPVIDEVSKRE